MWKGLMKCPLVGHSSKWDRQAVQIYEMIRMERKGEGESKAHPSPRHCHLLPGPLQVASYCGIYRIRTSPDLALCQSLNSSLADSTRLTSWYIDLAFIQSLRPTDPSQLSLRFPESSFQLQPLVFTGLSALSALVQNFQGLLSITYQYSSWICSKPPFLDLSFSIPAIITWHSSVSLSLWYFPVSE